jgi:hypothetical protein
MIGDWILWWRCVVTVFVRVFVQINNHRTTIVYGIKLSKKVDLELFNFPLTFYTTLTADPH